MNSIDLAKSGIAAMEAGNFDFIRDNCTDDMVFNAPGGMSLNRNEFINAQRALLRAFRITGSMLLITSRSASG